MPILHRISAHEAYRVRMSTYWWLGRRAYLKFILREISSVFVAWFVLVTAAPDPGSRPAGRTLTPHSALVAESADDRAERDQLFLRGVPRHHLV